jgi:hypothetical protein
MVPPIGDPSLAASELERRCRSSLSYARSHLLEYAVDSSRAEADLHYYQEGLWYWSMDAEA